MSKNEHPDKSAESPQAGAQKADVRADADGLEQIESIPTSRIGRILRTGWVARHAVPLALKRTVELVSSEKQERGELAEKILAEQEAYAEELFRTLGTMKGLAQKFGQMVSYLEGVLPAEFAPVYQRVLSRLQASAPALPSMVSQYVIEEELDCLIEDHFADFEEQPFAAASIGQVHRATLHDGTRVAVKIQYPDVDKAFESDMKNIKMLETLFAPLIRYYRGKDILELTRQQLLDELDYEREAKAQLRFQEMFAGHPLIYIPKVIEHLSTRKLLVTELVEGKSFREALSEPLEVRNRIGKVLFHYYWESIFLHHFVNGDPHPGNYIFLEDGRVACLDFGAAVPIEPSFAQNFRKNVEAYLAQDQARFRETVPAAYGISTDDPVVFEAYCVAIGEFLEPFHPDKQPFLFSPAWLEGYFEKAAAQAKQILTRGGKVPRLPPPANLPQDLPLIQRIGLGLSSLIARLQSELDWNQCAHEIFANARAREAS